MHDGPPAERPPLVGRTHELERLCAARQRAYSGAPCTALVTGEAGIGKTRLVQEFMASADGLVLAGGCVPVVGEALPFAPVTQAIREFVRSTDAQRSALPAELHRLLPPDPTRPIDPVTMSVLDAPVSASAQVRLFESFLAFLGELGRTAGRVTLVLEDLHWADRSTLDLVGFLARNLRTEPVFIALTLRSDDVGPDTPFRLWLAELERLSTVEEIPLARLRPTDATRLIAGLIGSTPVPAYVDRVYQASAGNPLFTEHLLAWADDPEGSLPVTLRELLGARVALLSEPARRTVRVASVLGRVVSLELLAAVADQTEAEVEEALRSAVDRHVIEPRVSGDYGFRHPLFRDVIYADLLPGERRRLHAAAATTLAALDDGASFSVVGEIARHWQAAGDADRAFASAVAAGLAAEEVYAFADADEYLTRAVQLGVDLPDSAFAELPIDRVELLAHAAQSANLTGHADRAVAHIRSAAPMTDDPVRRAQLLDREGAYCFGSGQFEEAKAAYEAALDLLPSESATMLVEAQIYAGLGMLAMASTQLAAARHACLQAMELARSAGDSRGEGRALNALGVVTAYGGDFDTGIAQLRQSLEIATKLNEPDDLGAAYIHLVHVLGLAGQFDDAVRIGVEGIAELRRVGLIRQDGAFLQANVAESMIKQGRWSEATDLLDEALAQQPPGLGAAPILVQGARLALAAGDLALAFERIQQVRGLDSEGGMPDAWWRELLELDAELALWQHEPAEAERMAGQGLSLVEQGDEQRFAGPLVVLALRAAADSAEDARARRAGKAAAGAMQRGQSLVERARRLHPDPLCADGSWWLDGRALALTGLAELARLEDRNDPRRWSEAAEAWEALDRPFQVAYARWREADALARTHERGNRPVAAVRHAYDLATQLGAAALVAEVTELARWYRIDLTAPEESDADSDSAAAAAIDDIGLTPRELEVLAGLAAGQTNREIADSLFISVKTASVHVSNILRKLDVSGREEAARVAYQLGLDRET
jgi:DNA-binding CsgD family transcriptional regulator